MRTSSTGRGAAAARSSSDGAGRPRRRLAARAAVAALVMALVVGLLAQADARVDPTIPPTPNLSRPVLLSLAGRVATAGEPLPTAEDPEPYTTGPAAESPTITPPPALQSGSGTLYAVGDSVLLGAEPYLRTTLDGWDVRLDAKVSRRVPEGFDLVRLNDDRIGDVLVIVLGHNYGGGGHFGPWLSSLLAEVSDVQRVVLVTVVEWSPAQPEVNRAIRAAPASYPNVVVADWAAVVAANPGFLRDHVHPNRAGAVALANLIAVMTGPAPSRDGRPPPRPRLLPIPEVDGSSSSGGSASSSSTSAPRTTSTRPTTGGTGGPTTAPSTTATTVPSTTATTVPSTTATTVPSTTATTAPSTTATTTATTATTTPSTTATTVPSTTATTASSTTTPAETTP